MAVARDRGQAALKAAVGALEFSLVVVLLVLITTQMQSLELQELLLLELTIKVTLDQRQVLVI